MNSVIAFFQNMAAQVPELLQPLIIALAGAVPFVEGEVSAVIGVWAGLNPIVAGLAGALGNFACVTVIVLLGARARKAVINRRTRTREVVPVGAGAAEFDGGVADSAAAVSPVADATSTWDAEDARFLDEPPAQKKPDSKGRIKFKRFLNRFGVPGASLLGPLAIPTQITSTILVGAGVKTSWILLWQGIAIAAWTTLTTLIATGALAFFAG